MEFVQHEPVSTSVELVGCGGTYAMICVGGVVGAVCVAVEELELLEDEPIEERLDEKNCPIPKSRTSARTITTIILFVLFIRF